MLSEWTNFCRGYAQDRVARVWRQIRRNYDRAIIYRTSSIRCRVLAQKATTRHRNSYIHLCIYTYIYIDIVTFARGAPRRHVAISHNTRRLPPRAPNAFIARINGARRFLIISLIYGTRAAPFTVSFLFPFFRSSNTQEPSFIPGRIMKTASGYARESAREKKKFHAYSTSHRFITRTTRKRTLPIRDRKKTKCLPSPHHKI